MKLSDYLELYKDMAKVYLESKGYTLEQVLIGSDAWSVAHASGICKHAYAISDSVYDAHIQTILQKIMPNVIFRDKKVY